MIRVLADEDFNHRVVRGLRRRNSALRSVQKCETGPANRVRRAGSIVVSQASSSDQGLSAQSSHSVAQHFVAHRGAQTGATSTVWATILQTFTSTCFSTV